MQSTQIEVTHAVKPVVVNIKILIAPEIVAILKNHLPDIIKLITKKLK